MQQPWVSIDLEADPHSAKVLTSTHAPTPWPEVGLLAAQSELRLQLLPALEARHTSESAALFRGHKLDRESLDRRYDVDSAEMEARHRSERAALVENYRAGRDVLERQFAADSADMQSKHLSETQAFLQQNLDLHRDMIAALAHQRKLQQEESDSLAAEKASMEAPGISGGDILQLNVGGESFVVTRGTLTQAKDSLLASKFNGRWEARHQLDNQGQIFLDYDPYCFKQVLAYLRSKAIERPDRPAPQPVIAPESQAQFYALLQFLGLEEFMGRHFFFDKCSTGASMTDIRTVLQKHTAAGIDESCLLAPAMPYGKVYHIKCHIESYDGQGLFFGLTHLQELSPMTQALAGWSTTDTSHSILKHGDWHTKSEWTGFMEDDKVLFRMDLMSGMLHMFCPRFSRAFSVSLTKVFSSSLSKSSGQAVFFRVVMRGAGVKIRLLPVMLQDMQDMSNMIK
ncbi:hypothetical protein WJX77_008075 [Trebouxia sp. C0004]